MGTAQQLLKSNGQNPGSVRPSASVFDAAHRMDNHRVGALPVVDRGRLVGIISEGDHTRKVVLKGRSARRTPVSAIMTRDVISVSADHAVEDCLRLMTDRRVKHLPVLDGQRLLGVISLDDVGRATISEQDILIEQMQTYINGGW